MTVRGWKWVPVVVLVGIAGMKARVSQGEDSPPLWLSKASGASEILIFPEIHRGKDGRGYVLLSEAHRIRGRGVVRAAAGEVVRADYDLIVQPRFEFHLGTHVFVNGRGEPLLAVDTTATPPALAVSRPYLEGGKIYLGTTRDTWETISRGYYRHLADSLERAVPELAVVARRSLKVASGGRLRDGFSPDETEGR